MLELFLQPENLIALLTLTALEIVLGIDNIVFLSILVGRLPEQRRQSARIFGLGLAMITRILLLLSLAWLMKLTQPLFTVLGEAVSGRDLILIAGGLFLLWKSTFEIHGALEGEHGTRSVKPMGGFLLVLVQIAILDIVFSLDSVITAVGMVDHVSIMVVAIVIAVGVMMLFARSIGEFVDEHPTIKMLALSFLILVGVSLVAEGLDFHIPKGYIYFAMAFSVGVEMLNLRLRKKTQAVRLHKPVEEE